MLRRHHIRENTETDNHTNISEICLRQNINQIQQTIKLLEEHQIPTIIYKEAQGNAFIGTLQHHESNVQKT